MDFYIYKTVQSVNTLSGWISQTKTSTMVTDINTNCIILLIQYFQYHDLYFYNYYHT